MVHLKNIESPEDSFLEIKFENEMGHYSLKLQNPKHVKFNTGFVLNEHLGASITILMCLLLKKKKKNFCISNKTPVNFEENSKESSIIIIQTDENVISNTIR